VEARATIKETSVSRVFVGGILVLVAMGLGAMGGYVTKGLSAGTTGAQTQVVRPAPGTVLHQDNYNVRKAVENPPYVQGLIDRAAAEQTDPGLAQNEPGYIEKYGVQQAPDTSAIRAVKGGTRGDHGDLP
jgi:hypothetical protein